MLKTKCQAFLLIITIGFTTDAFSDDKTESLAKLSAEHTIELMKQSSVDGHTFDINRLVNTYANILRNKTIVNEMKELQNKAALKWDAKRTQEITFLNSLADLPFMSQTKHSLFYTPKLQPESWATNNPTSTEVVTFSISAKTHMQKKISELQNQRVTAKVENLPSGLALLIMDMKIGEARRAYLPSWTMFGSQSKGDVPSYSTIIADVMLLNIRDSEVDDRDHSAEDVREERGVIFSTNQEPNEATESTN